MSECDPRNPLDFGQDNIPNLLTLLIEPLAKLLRSIFPPQPIRPDELYTGPEAQRRANVGNTTFAAWIEAGLEYTQPGSAAYMIWGDDLIRFIREHKDAASIKSATPPKRKGK